MSEPALLICLINQDSLSSLIKTICALIMAARVDFKVKKGCHEMQSDDALRKRRDGWEEDGRVLP